MRRLNEAFLHEDGRAEDLEQASYALTKAIRSELGKISFSHERGSFFWGLRFRRPLPGRITKIARQLSSEAKAYYLIGPREQHYITVAGVVLNLIPASKDHGKSFVQSYESDLDSGGFVGPLYRENIERALSQKVEATLKVSKSFDRWFLMLVDTIMPGTPWIDDLGAVSLNLRHFSGIAVLEPDSKLSFEWPVKCLDFRI